MYPHWQIPRHSSKCRTCERDLCLTISEPGALKAPRISKVYKDLRVSKIERGQGEGEKLTTEMAGLGINSLINMPKHLWNLYAHSLKSLF